MKYEIAVGTFSPGCASLIQYDFKILLKKALLFAVTIIVGNLVYLFFHVI